VLLRYGQWVRGTCVWNQRSPFYASQEYQAVIKSAPFRAVNDKGRYRQLPRDRTDRGFDRRRRRSKFQMDYHASRSAGQHLDASGGGSFRPPPDSVLTGDLPLNLSAVPISKNRDAGSLKQTSFIIHYLD
jgi:hypothetical protein